MNLNQSSSHLTSTLLEKEEEYKRLNAELEAQTALLVKEAEVMMKEQDSFLRQVSPSLPESTSPKKAPDSKADDATNIVDVVSCDTDLLSIAAGAFEDSDDDYDMYNVRSAMSRTDSTISSQLSKNFKSSKNSKGKKSQMKTSSASSTVFAKDIPMFSSAEQNYQDRLTKEIVDGDDVMPDVAAEMGSEAQIRFLKAKLRVLQEELNEQTSQCHKVTEECSRYKMELKGSREETERIRKNFNQQQIQIQKLKNGFEEEKRKNDERTHQLQSITKELDLFKREKKQASTTHNATEVRLNRANEELDKLKAQLQKQKSSDKESSSRDQREIVKVKNENKRLERLQSDSLAVMKKQQKLIGVLKRQILHIEAAKLLSFTEEEFVKALDWGNK